MKNLLRKLHIGGNHDDQVDAGRIIEGRSYEGSGSNATPRGSSAGAASAPATSPSPTSASNLSTPPEQKESRASGLTTFLNAVGSAVGRVGQSTSNNSNQVTTGGQVRQRLETSGGSAGDADSQISKAPSIKKRTPSLGGGDSNQIGLQSLQMLQSEEDYQVQIAMALSVSNSYISPSIANEAEKVQIEVAKRLSLGLSPSSAKNSQADIISYRYWACNMVDHDEIVPDGFYDVNGVLSESHLAESMPSLSDLTKMPISETSKIEAVLVDRNLDPDLVALEEKVAEISAGEPGLRKTELAQKIALIVVEHMGGPVGSDTEMLSRWRKASWDVKNTMKNVVLTLGCLTIGLTRHRALLFKVLADRVGLPCQLVKGRHYPGVEEEGAVNIVRVEDDREYIIDLMGAPGALIPPDKPQTAQTGNATEIGSSTDVSPKSAKTEQSYASLGGSSCDSPSGSMHSTRSTPEARDVNKDKEMNLRRGAGETAEAKANNMKLEGRHHSEPGELAGLSARPRLHGRSPSWTEGMTATAQTAGGRPLKDVFLGVAKEHPQLAQKLHDVLLESGVSPPPDLLAEISPKQLQVQVLDEKKAAEEKRNASEVPPPLPAPLAKKKGALRGRPPAGISKPSQQVVDEGSNSKDKLQRLNSVEGLGERRPLGGGGLQAIIPSTPAILPLVVVPPAAQEAFLQPGMMRHVPVAAAAAATAAVVASTMVAAAAKVDGDANLEVPMAAAATATAAVVAATSAVAGRRIDSNESSPHGSSEKEKGKEGSGKRRTLSEENERVDRVEKVERGGSGGGRPRHSGDKRSNETDASSPGNSGGKGGSDAKTGSGGGANSNFGDGLDGEMSIEEERNADGYSGSQQKRIDSVLKDVAEWEIPWEDIIIGERIGLGSYGEVYRGDWHGSEVAVKKFLDQDLSGDALEEFRLEVRIMRRLRHPNVVLFMGAVTRPPHLSIVTEFLPRGSLYRLIHRPNNQLDERRRLRMAFDVAKGMNYLHSSTPLIVHRDLKSPNLLVDKNWVVKVCDFGLSRMKNNTFLSSKSTAGTPEWMAPEMLRNEPSNEKCDVYSFGVILWELATLRQPWAGMNPMQVVGAVGFQHRRLDIPRDMDPQLANIIRECWQNDPNARPSFSQLMAALKPLQRPLVAHQDSQKHGQGPNTTIQSTQQPQVSPQQ